MKPTYDQLSQQLSDSQAALGKAIATLEVSRKALEGFKYLDNGHPKELNLVEYAKLVKDIYANGAKALVDIKETLNNPSLAKELRWREAVERGINSLKDFRERVLAEIPDEEFCQDEETHYSNLTEGVLPNLFDDMTKALKAIEEARHEGI